MKAVGAFLLNQSQKVLNNKQHAILCAVLLAVLPFATWLSVALVCLVCLRKGAQAGFEVLLPAAVIHSVPLMLMVPVEGAVINTLVIYLPSYFAALTLRSTISWQRVGGLFLLIATIACLSVQMLAPEFVASQFKVFKNLLAHYQEYQQLLEATSSDLSGFILAQFFFSIQILSVVVSATISLLFARSIQAKLFMPGGLKEELLAFRSGKIALGLALANGLAAYYELPFAINLLPLMLSYFLASGFSLTYCILEQRKHAKMLIIVLLLVVVKPLLVLGSLMVLGGLDSIFNFRLYLPTRVRETT